MTNVLVRKLELFGPIGDDDRALLNKITMKSRVIGPNSRIIGEGDNPDDVHLVLEGLACRSKITSHGKRTIFALLLPGDFCDLNVFILKSMDHDIRTIARSRLVEIPRATVLELTNRPTIVRALWWATLVDEATLREWLVNIGQRDALQRMAHLFCELHMRMSSIGLAEGGHFELPISQAALGDALGISPVHTNRMLQDLRSENLVDFRSRQIKIPDVRRLHRMCDFNPNYLHLDGGKKDESRAGEGTAILRRSA